MAKKCNIDPQLLYETYIKSSSLQEACSLLNISRTTGYRIFKEAGLKTDKTRRTKYSCDDQFFSLDTPESFYWAGFIAADGCIYYNNKGSTQLKINLAVMDREHLEKFVSAINFTGRIEDVAWRNGTGILVRITSNQIVKDLVRFNIVPRKTLIYSFPEWLIQHPLLNHFMRGYFDGDGSIWYYLPKTNKTQVAAFEILGTEHFVNNYCEILTKNCDVKFSIYPSVNIFKGRFSGNQGMKRIRDFLYKDASEHMLLKRKYDRFFDPEIENNRRKRKIIGTNLEDGSIITFNSIAEAISVGFDQHIVDCCNGKRKHNKGYSWKYVE